MKYRKKPVVVEAVRWDGNAHTANKFIGEDYEKDWQDESPESQSIIISPLEGGMLCDVGDWIIKEINGEVYPCKPDIFEKTYELVK